MAYGLTPKRVKQLAYEIAKVNKMKFPKNWDVNKEAEKKWFRGFLKRNKSLSIRKPEACSLSRLTTFNFHNVTKFTENLSIIFEQYPKLNNPSRIYNLDETGKNCDYNKHL